MNEFEPDTASPGDAKEARMWATLLHLSLLAGLLIPFGGLVVPVVIYFLKKEQFPSLEPHWYVVLNWILSSLIYAVIFSILIIILIGIPLLWALALLFLIFPIIGAIKANDGEVWPYPLSIRFFGNG